MKDFTGLRMTVDLIGEGGYEQALYGLSLSYAISESFWDFVANDKIKRMLKVADKLFNRNNGENKFLESIVVWLDINAPRYWWQEFDTYRVGITKQSASTMHTITKRLLTQDDFVEPIDPTTLYSINAYIADKNFRAVKRHLPESFLQRREVCTNYKTLRNILYQRRNHRLPEWHLFINSILSYTEHPELLQDVINVEELVNGQQSA